MRTTQDITTPRTRETAVALGFFDGVHLGHRAVIGRAVELAREQSLLPAVFTFSPDGSVPASKGGLTLLQTREHKELLMAQMGVEELVTPDFGAFMGLSPEQYVDGLLHRVLRARVLVCGENYRFGKAARAGVAELKALGLSRGIQLVTVPPVLYEGELVSSTRIRQALRDGAPELAREMLGTPFLLEGPVLHGRGLGHRLQSPTVNQAFPPGFTVPAYGVYLSRVTTSLGSYWGVTNIGVRPTVDGENINCETYLIGFEGDLYGQRVTTALHRRLRQEQKFPDVYALSAQIQVDIQAAQQLIQTLEINTLV